MWLPSWAYLLGLGRVRRWLVAGEASSHEPDILRHAWRCLSLDPAGKAPRALEARDVVGTAVRDPVGTAAVAAVDIRAALVVDASGRKQRRGGKKNSNTNESGNVCGCKSEHASVSGSLVRVEVSRAICRANTTPSVSMAALGSS